MDLHSSRYNHSHLSAVSAMVFRLGEGRHPVHLHQNQTKLDANQGQQSHMSGFHWKASECSVSFTYKL